QTRKALKTQFLLDELGKTEEVEVGQQELIEYLMMQSQQYGMDPNTFAQMMDQQGQVEGIVGEVARRKALAAALDKASIVDADGNAIDLDEIMPERQGGEEESAAGDAAADTATADPAEG